jgi:hypothetical protein
MSMELRLTRCGGPHQLPQKRSLALASVLQSLAAAEIAICEIFGAPQFLSFSTLSAQSGHVLPLCAWSMLWVFACRRRQAETAELVDALFSVP